MKRFLWIPCALSLAVVAGCATGESRSERVCLSDHEITSFSPVGNEHLYIEGIGNRHYLFTMQRGCFGLRSANTIGIPDTVGRICSNSSDRVIYDDMARRPESCLILDIERVLDRDEARALAEAREKARD